jgi:thiol-disulfide isomerase/thioredoxin
MVRYVIPNQRNAEFSKVCFSGYLCHQRLNFMKNLQLIFIIALLALSAGIGVKMFNQWQADQQPMPLPIFSFPDLTGTPHSSNEWQGKILVLNFWATWCPACLKEIPAFMALQTQFAEKVQFVGIALDDLEAVKTFQQKAAVNYPLLISGDWAGFDLAKKLGNFVSAIPYTVVVNRDGLVVYHHAGELTADELQAVISPLL